MESEEIPTINESDKYLRYLLNKLFSEELNDVNPLLLKILRDLVRVQLEIVTREKQCVLAM